MNFKHTEWRGNYGSPPLYPLPIVKQTHPRSEFGNEVRQGIFSKLLSNFRVDMYYLIKEREREREKREKRERNRGKEGEREGERPHQKHYHFPSVAVWRPDERVFAESTEYQEVLSKVPVTLLPRNSCATTFSRGHWLLGLWEETIMLSFKIKNYSICRPGERIIHDYLK